MKLSREMEERIKLFIEVSQGAIKMRNLLDQGFKDLGLLDLYEDKDMNGINDILIDSSMTGDIPGAIRMINKSLKEHYPDE